ncbi:unnamed protein product, partial [Polarella glacialis]
AIAALVAPDETASDLFRTLRSSRGTGIACLDQHLPGGSLGPGQLVALHGETGCGKSVLLRNALAAYILPQSCGGHALPSVLIDAERTFDPAILARLLRARLMSSEDWRRQAAEEKLDVAEAVSECLARLLILSPSEPIDMLRQLRQLKKVLAANPTAGILAVDSMSAWQSLAAAFPRTVGPPLKECWRALARLQAEHCIAVVVTHRDPVATEGNAAIGGNLHLGLRRLVTASVNVAGHEGMDVDDGDDELCSKTVQFNEVFTLTAWAQA